MVAASIATRDHRDLRRGSHGASTAGSCIAVRGWPSARAHSISGRRPP